MRTLHDVLSTITGGGEECNSIHHNQRQEAGGGADSNGAGGGADSNGAAQKTEADVARG